MSKPWTARKLQARAKDAMRWRDSTTLTAERWVNNPGSEEEPEIIIKPRNQWAPVLKVLRFGKDDADAWAKLPKRYLEALEEIKRLQDRVAELEQPHWAGQPTFISEDLARTAAECNYEALRKYRGDPDIPTWEENYSSHGVLVPAMYETLLKIFTNEEETQK